MKTFYALCITLLFNASTYAQCPDNLDFEKGTKNNWVCKSGTYTTTKVPKAGTISVFGPNCQNPGGINAPLVSAPFSANPAPDQHVITTGQGRDPNTNNVVPVVAPGGGSYSLRLGDAVGGANLQQTLAKGISYTMSVTAQNAGLTYMYAVVMCEATAAGGGATHDTQEAPRFDVLLTNGSGTKIDCGSYEVESSTHAGLNKGAKYYEGGATVERGQWWYSDWVNVTINLSSFIGQTVTLEFRVTDCCPILMGNTGAPGSHGAYAYIDAKCTPMLIKAPIICAQPNVEACAPDGFKAYKWKSDPKITSPLDGKCITIKDPKPGEKYTVELIPFSNSACTQVMTVTLIGIKITGEDVTLCPTTTQKYTLKTVTVPSNKPKYAWTSYPLGAVITKPDDANPVIDVPTTDTKYIVEVTDSAGCKAIDTINVKINCTIGIELNGGEVCEAVDGCVDLLAKVTGGKTPFKFKWTPGVDPSDSIGVGPFKVCPKKTTTYSVTVTDAMGLTATASNIVVVNPKPTITATSATICKGTPAILNAGSSEVNTKFTWKLASTLNQDTGATVIATPDYTTTYTITGVTDKGCKDSTTATVDVKNYIKIDAGDPQVLCFGDSVQLKATGPINTVYTWTGPGIQLPTIANPKAFPPVGTTIYTVNAVDASGCPGQDSVPITVNPMPVAKFILDKYQGCVPLFVNFQNVSTAPLGSTSYWDFGDKDATADNPNTIVTKDLKVSHDYKTVGTFSIKLKIVTPQGCQDSLIKTDTVRTFPYPVAEFTLNPYETDTWKPTINYFNKSTGHHKDSLKWYLQTDPKAIISTKEEFAHVYKAAGTYMMCLKIATDHGCPDQICHPAVVKPDWSFFIPNAFTPNGDGKNEKFNGVGVNVIEYRMDIFDRWGLHICTINKVDTQDDRGNGWDGTVDGGSGEKQQEDCYVYKVKLTDIFNMKHEYIGRVTLIK